MTTATLSDDEWQRVQEDLNEHIDTMRSVYADAANKNEIRLETDDVLVLADASGHELNDIADIVGVDSAALSQRMHEEARQRYDGDGAGDPWSVADPVVIIKED